MKRSSRSCWRHKTNKITGSNNWYNNNNNNNNELLLSLYRNRACKFSMEILQTTGFITAFEHLIEGKTSSPNSRLYCLIQYTSGHVKELMQSCSSMEGDRGYSEARRLLKQRYGRNYRIAAAHVQQLIDGPVMKSEDGAALQQFSTRLTSCTNTLKELGYLSKLDNPDSLNKINGQLPSGMRLKRRDVVDCITQVQGREVTIEDITKFVNAKARAVSHPIFGKISEPERNAQIKDSSKRSNGFRGFKAAS